jgi:CBS domain-containing protein
MERQVRVENILPVARKRLITVGDDAPLLRTATLLGAPHVSLVVVCDTAGVAVGVLSKADIVRQISHCDGHACTTAAASVMTRNIISCNRRDWLDDVWSTMKNTGVRQIPILDENSKPLGIVYAIDAIHALLGEAQNREQMLHDYVMSAGYH